MNAPIFPLPTVVLFPDTFLPLHVFEPRYRAMVSDALEGPRLIAVVLAREERPPGAWPSVHRIGSVGRIEVVEERDDGRYDLVLHGLSRVRLDRLHPAEGDYFTAELSLLGEALPDLQDPEVAERRAEFLLAARTYEERLLEGRYGEEYLTATLPYRTLVNRAAAMLQVGLEEKQALLALDDLGERARSVERRMVEEIEARAAVERFVDRRPEDPDRN